MSLFVSLLFVIYGLFSTLGEQPTVIDLTSIHDIPTRIAVQICSGLFNKESHSNGVYTLMKEPYDTDWLHDLYNISNPVLTAVDEFMLSCLSSVGVGYIRYNYTLQHLITPNLITLASVLNAVLLQDDSAYIANSSLLFDAITEFANYSALDASKWMYYKYVNQTKTLAFMNPNQINPGLIDFIVKEKIFNFYLNNACIRGTQEYAFTEMMVNPENNPWHNPIPVMGYNDAWPVAGDIFEAETDCNHLHNMGQIASDGFNNLAFFSRTPAITKPLVQNPSPYIKFNASKIYLAFTIGDGDNLSYLKGGRRDWLKQRVHNCQQSNFSYDGCFPLQWSISPHPLSLAPLMLQWYYNESYKTKNDYFVLPPSGDLYAYPSEMDYDTAQANFISSTQNDCKLLGCNATVAWEFVFTWFKAINEYFPRYGHGAHDNHSIYGIFAVNVPYNIPVYDFWFNHTTLELQFYKILNGVVLFKPREWRGTNHTSCTAGVPLSFENCLTVKEMAKEINHYPKGTVTTTYITSDGGGNLQMLYDVVPELNEYVRLVSPTQLIDLALQRGV